MSFISMGNSNSRKKVPHKRNLNLFNKLKIFITVILVSVILIGCEKNSDEIVSTNPFPGDLSVVGVTATDTVIYSKPDSIAVITANVYSTKGISGVYCTVFNPLGKFFNHSQMFDNGRTENGDEKADDSIYSTVIRFSKTDISGFYDVEYSAVVGAGSAKIFAHSRIYYFNNQENIPPQLSDLTMPDTVAFNQSFKFSVTAKDLNGLSDIKEVYYELYNPSGVKLTNSQGISKFPLSDNGDVNVTGDKKAGDGIFTQKLTIPKGQPAGRWKFDFTAVDRSDSLSNTITHFVEVK